MTAPRVSAESLRLACRSKMQTDPRRERGFALLIVLWWIVLLALLGSQLATAGRLDARRAYNVRDSAIAEAAAEGVVQEAIFHLLDGSQASWRSGEGVHLLRVPGGQAEVEIRNEAGKLGLNVAPPSVLTALLTRLGVAPHDAAALSDAVLDWRTATQTPRPLGAKEPYYRAAGLAYSPPNADFETVDELALVRGMTAPLLAKLAPFVSVDQTDDTDPELAAPDLQMALVDAGGLLARPGSAGPPRSAMPVFDVTVTVKLSGGARFVRHCVVRLAADSDGQPFQIRNEY